MLDHAVRQTEATVAEAKAAIGHAHPKAGQTVGAAVTANGQLAALVALGLAALADVGAGLQAVAGEHHVHAHPVQS